MDFNLVSTLVSTLNYLLSMSHHSRAGLGEDKMKWTDEERDIVRRDYSHTDASAEAIAQRLRRTTASVKGQVQRIGIAKRSDRHPWTPEEEERLAELIPKYAPVTVARMMHRSLNSVVVKVKRLKISRRVRDGWFTKRDICQILAVDHRWVQSRIDMGILPASYHYPNSKPQKNGSACWHIKEKDFREFIRRYPQDLLGRNVDLITIVDILAGVNGNNH